MNITIYINTLFSLFRTWITNQRWGMSLRVAADSHGPSSGVNCGTPLSSHSLVPNLQKGSLIIIQCARMDAVYVFLFGCFTGVTLPTKIQFVVNSSNRISLLWGTVLVPNGTTAIATKRKSAKKYIVKDGNPSALKDLI